MEAKGGSPQRKRLDKEILSPMFFTSPIDENALKKLKDREDGTLVFISGILYTLRDSSVVRLRQLSGTDLDTLRKDFKNAVVYFSAPSRRPPWFRSGSFGPTTSSRFVYVADFLASLGFAGFIGKGTFRPPEGTFYFMSFGGAGAYLADRILDYSDFLFPELGPESIKKVVVRRFPAILFKNGFGGPF